MMIDLNLGVDEGILLESDCATWLSGNETDLTALILTNKKLYMVYEKSNGLFSKSDTLYVEKSLSDIKVINGKPLVERVKGDYGINLQIQFVDSRDRFYFSERTSRTTDTWVNKINKLLTGVEVPTRQKEALSDAKSTFSGIASGFKKAADSAIQTAADSAKQYAESDTAAKHKESIAGAFGALSGFAASVKSAADDAVHEAVDQYNEIKEERKAADAEFRQMLSGTQAGENPTERQQEFAGVVLKCPSCGAPINQTTVICPDCGHRITGRAAVSSVQKFSDQLMILESKRKGHLGEMFGTSVNPTDKQKLSLIRSFPIPNTIDDIQEFIMLAIANIDVNLSKKSLSNKLMSSGIENKATINKTISDAWVSKMEQAYQKAKISFPEDPAFEAIKQMVIDKMNELKRPFTS